MKVLIFINQNELKDCGGPIGYNNILYNEILKNNNLEIEFLKIPNIKHGKFYNFLKKIKIFKIIKKYFFYKDLLNDKKNHTTNIDLKKYDLVHFHLTQDMYNIRDTLSNYSGKVLLTSHSPTIASKELIIDMGKIQRIVFKKLCKKLIKMDEYAFKRANFLIFPCEEAEETYKSELKMYSNIRLQKKIFYVPTGIIVKKANISSIEIRKQYNIPVDAFLISYVGRHNTIKGYDILKEIGKKVLKKYNNVYFIIAGKEGPLFGIKDKRWIEVGWTSDPYSIINSSDLFILPNKRTYFDLILLEVLSLKKNVLLSYTGGNKYIYKFNKGGILKYSSIDDALIEIDTFLSLDKKSIEDKGKTNLDIINDNFTSEIFYSRYMEIYKKIYETK